MPFKTASRVVPAGFLLLTASVARGQATTDAQLAQSLFERGRMLMTNGQTAEACPVLAESQRLDPGDGTLLNLALCHEKEGRTATAWSEFNVALGGAVKDGRKDREELARQRIAALETKLSHLTVLVPKGAEGLAISLDGVTLGPAAWGVPAAVDPGSHHVLSTARGQVTSDQTVDVHADGDNETVTVPVPTAAVPLPAPRVATTCTAGRVWDGSTCLKPSRGKSPWRWVAGGGAVVATAFTVAAGIASVENHSTMTSLCNVPRKFCSSQAGVDAASSATTWAWASTVGLGVAVASAAAFIFWPDRGGVTVAPAATEKGASVLVQGRF